MGVMLAEPELATGESTEGSARRTHWPLSLLFLGIPLWWALGMMTVLPIAVAALLAWDLRRRRRPVILPPGFAVWALFLVWVALGVFVLWADAPDAVPGGGASRLLVFLSKAAWYLTATVVMLWVANQRESELPTRWVYQLVGSLFVVTTVGGLVGLLVPGLEFTSLVERLLPAGLRANALVQSMTHPAVADIQTVLGRPVPRPRAPFAFANTWGSVMALTLPFFLVAWLQQGRSWQRLSAPLVLLVAAVPVVYSLNRGLWACLAVGGAGLLILQIARRRRGALVVSVAMLTVIVVAFVASPLGAVFQERLAHQHSNDRRGALLGQTVMSTVEGSPIMGFGSTRDVLGNFTSIAGGSTPSCSACGVPPLGTQGHLWLVIFSQGFVGLALFLAFFCVALAGCWRCRTTTQTVCTFTLAFFGIQVFVYDTLELPFVIVLLAIGLMWRERIRPWDEAGKRLSAERASRRLRRSLPVLAAFTALGTLIGGVWVLAYPRTYTAPVSVLVNKVPIEIASTTADSVTPRSRQTTLDTEAALVRSKRTLTRAAEQSGQPVGDLRERISVTAPADTRVMTIAVREPDADRAAAAARLVTSSYLQGRDQDLTSRRARAVRDTRRQLSALERASAGDLPAGDGTTAATAATPVGGSESAPTTETLQTTLRGLMLTPTSVGEVIRTERSRPLRRQPEVPLVSGFGLGLLVGALVIAVYGAELFGRGRRRR